MKAALVFAIMVTSISTAWAGPKLVCKGHRTNKGGLGEFTLQAKKGEVVVSKEDGGDCTLTLDPKYHPQKFVNYSRFQNSANGQFCWMAFPKRMR